MDLVGPLLTSVWWRRDRYTGVTRSDRVGTDRSSQGRYSVVRQIAAVESTGSPSKKWITDVWVRQCTLTSDNLWDEVNKI
jgi:hypothetical protein